MEHPPAAQPLFQPTTLANYIEGDLAVARWAVEGVWPANAAGVIAGPPKASKSTNAVELAVSLWTGTPMWGNPSFPVHAQPASVLYVQQENSDTRVQHDLQRILVARGLGTITEEQQDVAVADDGATITETISHFTFDLDAQWYRTIGERRWLAGDVPTFDVLSHGGINLSTREHQDWIWQYVVEHGVKYIFLDPLYMLAGAALDSTGEKLLPVLAWLTQLHNLTGCAPIITHHMSGKDGATFGPEGMLGSTYVHAWYEAALFVRQTETALFHVHVDAQRDLGATAQYVLRGEGVGCWDYDADYEPASDIEGRAAPKKDGAKMRMRAFALLQAQHPDWTDEQYAHQLGLRGTRTIERYRAQLITDTPETDAAQAALAEAII